MNPQRTLPQPGLGKKIFIEYILQYIAIIYFEYDMYCNMNFTVFNYILNNLPEYDHIFNRIASWASPQKFSWFCGLENPISDIKKTQEMTSAAARILLGMTARQVVDYYVHAPTVSFAYREVQTNDEAKEEKWIFKLEKPPYILNRI
jgi:hypothetical protein